MGQGTGYGGPVLRLKSLLVSLCRPLILEVVVTELFLLFYSFDFTCFGSSRRGVLRKQQQVEVGRVDSHLSDH